MNRVKIAARKVKGLSALIAAGMCASGCGGGFDATAPASTGSAQGLWIGSTNTGRTVTGLVLSDGTFYLLYSPVGNSTTIAGVFQGTGSSSLGKFSSSNARDFNLEGLGVLAATVSASFAPKQSLNATVSYASGGVVTTTGTYDTDYETAPSSVTLAGTYAGQVVTSAGIENATLVASTTGALSGASTSGCAVSGNAAPRADGNAYNISITFAGAPCIFANQTFSGIGYFSSITKRLYAAAPNAARNDGVLFVGTKP